MTNSGASGSRRSAAISCEVEQDGGEVICSRVPCPPPGSDPETAQLRVLGRDSISRRRSHYLSTCEGLGALCREPQGLLWLYAEAEGAEDDCPAVIVAAPDGCPEYASQCGCLADSHTRCPVWTHSVFQAVAFFLEGKIIIDTRVLLTLLRSIMIAVHLYYTPYALDDIYLPSATLMMMTSKDCFCYCFFGESSLYCIDAN